MIKNVKVSIVAIREFGRAICSIENYSPKLSKYVSWFNECIQYISQSIIKYRETIDELKRTEELLEEKKKSIDAQIEDLIKHLKVLEDELDLLYEDLKKIPETITLDDDGREEEVYNPEYEVVEHRINEIKNEIEENESQIELLRQRINHAYSVLNNIYAMKTDTLESISSFEGIIEECRNSINEIEDIIRKSTRNSEAAEQKIKRIEEIIGEYLRIKMKYESLMFECETNGAKKTYSKEEIKAHDIKLDQNGRIISYDGISFGGAYNTYETRLGGTMVSNNPILGYYEGERGESKFIPADRSAEGIVVIELLKNYNIDGIEYKNAEPYFEVCAEAVVCIDSMSMNRNNYSDSFGIPKLGNFAQADIACAKMWNEQKRDGRTNWDGREVRMYRKKFGLTWHEKSDTKTMIMMKSEINLFFNHTGGCSECRVRDSASLGNSPEEVFDE